MISSVSGIEIKERIHACWLGKAIGGTLGAPHEGVSGPLGLDFYTPVPTGALPNDDLDLQVVWLHYLRTGRFRQVTPQILSDAWQRHVLFPFDEYGIARRNRALGLSGARQGAVDNFFGECMGGAIRSELWACVAPGDPARAAGFAWADAVVDHSGEGVWAEVFNAALQSAAFVERDRVRLIDGALSFLPDSSQLKEAVRQTIAWWHADRDWRSVRERVLGRYYTGNFTHVTCNICFQLIGWFDGGDDFGRAICTAVNCGLDTDCTGATLGALLGILDPHGIPSRWSEPIGEAVILSDPIVFVAPPRDLGQLTDWTMELAEQLRGGRPAIGEIPPHEPATPETAAQLWRGRVAPVANHQGLESDAPRPGCWKNSAPLVLHGAWSRWRREDVLPFGRLVELDFEVGKAGDYKLMVFWRAGAAAWIDGTRVLDTSSLALADDPFVAPSFHRAGAAAVIVAELARGRHRLAIWLKAFSAESTMDLVWGFGEPEGNLWAMDVRPCRAVSAFASEVAAASTTSG